MRVLSVLILSLILVGCFSSLGPSEDEIKAKLSKNEIPTFWRISDIDIVESENFGTDEIPRIRTRFQTTIEALENLYIPGQSSRPLEAANNQPVIRINGHRIISLGAEKGTELNVTGIVTSTQRGEAWSLSFSFDDEPWEEKGIALYEFEQDVVVAGSDKEIAMLDQTDETWREQQAQQKAAQEAAKREIAERNAPLLELVNKGYAIMNYLSERNGSGYAVLQFPEDVKAERRFEFTLTTKGGDMGMIGMVDNGRFIMTPQQGESGQSGRCGAALTATADEIQGESDCYVFFGDVKAIGMTQSRLHEHFLDANQALLNFFERAQNVKYYNYQTRNETFGGGTQERMLVNSASSDNIDLTFLARARDDVRSSATWYIQYGTVRSKTVDDKYFGLTLSDNGGLKGRRYTRLNRPIAISISAP